MGKGHSSLCVSDTTRTALGEGRLLEMKHGGRKKGLVYIEEGRPPSVLLQVAKFRENSTNEDCNKSRGN